MKYDFFVLVFLAQDFLLCGVKVILFGNYIFFKIFMSVFLARNFSFKPPISRVGVLKVCRVE